MNQKYSKNQTVKILVGEYKNQPARIISYESENRLYKVMPFSGLTLIYREIELEEVEEGEFYEFEGTKEIKEAYKAMLLKTPLKDGTYDTDVAMKNAKEWWHLPWTQECYDRTTSDQEYHEIDIEIFFAFSQAAREVGFNDEISDELSQPWNL